MERYLSPEQLIAEAKRVIAEVEAQNPHLTTSGFVIHDSVAHAYNQSSQYLHQLQVTREQIKQIEQDVLKEREQHQQEVDGLRLEAKKFADEANRLRDQAGRYHRELARYQPDPNDPRDWSGEPFWQQQGRGEMTPRPMNSVTLALEDVQRKLEKMEYQPGRLEKFYDLCEHPAVRYGGFVVITAGYALLSHFHLVLRG